MIARILKNYWKLAFKTQIAISRAIGLTNIRTKQAALCYFCCLSRTWASTLTPKPIPAPLISITVGLIAWRILLYFKRKSQKYLGGTTALRVSLSREAVNQWLLLITIRKTLRESASPPNLRMNWILSMYKLIIETNLLYFYSILLIRSLYTNTLIR